MFCPRCGEEFAWHVMACPTCGVDTVDRLPGPEPDPDVQLVTVFATGEAALIAFVKSLLEGEGIEYMVRGAETQNLFGVGALTDGYNFITGPAEFLVRAEDEERTRELLGGLIRDRPPDDPLAS